MLGYFYFLICVNGDKIRVKEVCFFNLFALPPWCESNIKGLWQIGAMYLLGARAIRVSNYPFFVALIWFLEHLICSQDLVNWREQMGINNKNENIWAINYCINWG